jgi:hypothetical protein
MTKTRDTTIVPIERITHSILIVRGQRVLLDSELAALYDVTTKALNQAVKRNAERFPEDFMFRLSPTEADALNRSQSVTGSQKHRDPRFRRSPSPNTAPSWPPPSSTVRERWR